MKNESCENLEESSNSIDKEATPIQEKKKVIGKGKINVRQHK